MSAFFQCSTKCSEVQEYSARWDITDPLCSEALFTVSFQKLSGQDIHACNNQCGFWLLLVHRSVHLCHRIPTKVLHDIVLVTCITTSLYSAEWILIHYRVAASITVYIPVSHDRNDYTLARSYYLLLLSPGFYLEQITCVSDTHPPQLSSLQHMYSFFFAQNWTSTAHLDIHLATNLT